MRSKLSSTLSLGTATSHGNLTLTPILASEDPLLSIECISLENALAAGTTRITEISAEGHVPELLVRNAGTKPVLILDGEELVGAKQNRTVNLTILVAPQSEIVIPVSCIEAGRWSYSRPAFAAAGRVLNHKIRSRKAEDVTRNLKARRVRFSNQRAIWEDVNEALGALYAASPTRALSDAFETRAEAIEAYVAAFKPLPQQIGVVYRIDGALAGLDLFGSEGAFADAYPKLVRGAALQALAGFEATHDRSLDERAFLDAALRAPGERFPAVGLGEEVRIDTAEIAGAALELDGRLVHLFAFPRQAQTGRKSGPVNGF
jgi:hypothetical protein